MLLVVSLRRRAYRAAGVFVAAVLLAGAAANAAITVLPITPIAQQKPDWCWLSSGEMIFRFYGVPSNYQPSYQCGILLAANIPCANYGSGSFNGDANGTLANMLAQYPAIMQTRLGIPVRQLRSQIVNGPLTDTQISYAIDNAQPFIAGVSPSMHVRMNQPQHAVVVIGYDYGTDAFGQPYENLYVDDPFPYNTAPQWIPDPYLNSGAQMVQPGEYLASLAGFTRIMNWGTSIVVTPT